MSIFRRIVLGAAIVMFCAEAIPVQAQIYVHVRPSKPKVVVKARPARPDGAIWVDEDWRVNNGRYEYNGGRWERPVRRGMIWRPGHWKSTARRGHIWVPGRWVVRRRY